MPRKSFLLRMDPSLLSALQQWAEQDLRSLNGQIEYLLRQAVVKRGMKVADAGNQDDEGEQKREQSPLAPPGRGGGGEGT